FMNFNLYTPKARTHNEEDFRELVDQVSPLHDRIRSTKNSRTRQRAKVKAIESSQYLAITRSDPLLEMKSHAKHLALMYDKTIDRLQSAHAKEKSELEGRVAKAEVRLKSADSDSAQLRAEIRELQKDCKIYRQKLAKVEVLRMESEEANDVFSTPSTAAASGRISSSSRENRCSEQRLEDFEKLNHEHRQLEADFQTLLTLKEESIQEKDVMGKKMERLQTELSYLLNGDTRRIGEDLDDVLAENRFLKAQLNSAQEESDCMKVRRL
ncbi:hypothetical protein PFISCL1PPCAC_22171, partial [Pristionchus fissidentatus]